MIIDEVRKVLSLKVDWKKYAALHEQAEKSAIHASALREIASRLYDLGVLCEDADDKGFVISIKGRVEGPGDAGLQGFVRRKDAKDYAEAMGFRGYKIIRD